MSQRKHTPDVLADLLGGSAPTADTVLPAKQQNSKTAKQQNGKTVSPQNSKAAFVEAVEADAPDLGASGKVKVTFYLSESALEQLEDAQMTLRKLARQNERRGGKAATSKSALLEAALKIACDELEQGTQSRLAQALLNA